MDKSGFSESIGRIRGRRDYDPNDAGYKRIIKRIETEAKIARKAVDSLLAAGYTVGVHDGEEVVVRRSTSVNEVMKALASVDEEHLLAYDPATGKRVGAIYLVYGNDGTDVISDYSVSLEAAMKPVNAYAEQLEARER